MPKLKKYTDEQLSRILSCAAAGELYAGGGVLTEADSVACVEQAAYANYSLVGGNAKRMTSFDRAFNNVGNASLNRAIKWLKDNGLM